MSSDPGTVLHIRIPKRIRDWLDARAKADDRKMAYIARRLLEQAEEADPTCDCGKPKSEHHASTAYGLETFGNAETGCPEFSRKVTP